MASAEEAAQCLMFGWPGEAGRKHLRARRACADVIVGHKAAPVARRAFAEAAREAGILRD